MRALFAGDLIGLSGCQKSKRVQAGQQKSGDRTGGHPIRIKGGNTAGYIICLMRLFASLFILAASAQAGEIIDNGTFGSPAGTSLQFWTTTGGGNLVSGSGAAGYMFSPDNSTGTIRQTGISGWNSGLAPSGAAQLKFEFGWNNGNPDNNTSAVMRVRIGTTVYTTITTGRSGGSPGTATIAYQSGATGSPATVSAPTTPGGGYQTWQSSGISRVVTVNLPNTVVATGDLTFEFVTTGSVDDFFIANVSAISRRPTLQITKISLGGTASFTFSGNNGWTNQTIATASPGIGVTGRLQTLSVASTTTTITEGAIAGYAVTAIACTGLGGGTAATNLSARSLTLDTLATAAANTIKCTYTNAKLPTVRIDKISTGGTGSFAFGGDNGFGSDSIATVASGTLVNGTTKTLAAPGTVTTLSETIPPTYFVSGISCSGLGTGSATYNLDLGTVVLDANATAPGNVITCLYSNTLSDPKLDIIKSADTAGPVQPGQLITYTFTVTNSGNRPISAIRVQESFNGLGSPPVPANETLSVDSVPVGDSSNGAINDGIWQTLGVGDVVTYTASYQVQQADIDQRQ